MVGWRRGSPRRCVERSSPWSPGCDQATISCAATIGPMPGSLSSAGASVRTWPSSSRSSSAASRVAASMRRARLRKTSRFASSSALAEVERRRRLQRSSSFPTDSPCSCARLVGGGDDDCPELPERFAGTSTALRRATTSSRSLAAFAATRERERLGRERRPRGPDRAGASSLPFSRRSLCGVRLISSTVSPGALR